MPCAVVYDPDKDEVPCPEERPQFFTSLDVSGIALSYPVCFPACPGGHPDKAYVGSLSDLVPVALPSGDLAPRCDEDLGEEYEVDIVYPQLHDGNGFCYEMPCPCHEDEDNIETLGEQVADGLASTDDADRIYRGKTV